MADQRITELTLLTEADVNALDVLPIVDISASETKKVRAKDLFEAGATLADSGSIDIIKLNQSSATKLATVAIADDAITAAKLADDSSINYGPTEPTTANFEGRGHVSSTTKYLKIYDGSVYQQVIAPTAGIEDLAVTTSKLAANAVTTAKIDASGLAAAAIATDAVSTVKIQALAVTEAKLAAGAVTEAKIGANAVTTAKVIDDAVTYAKIQNVSTTDKILGRATASAGNIEEITCTAAGRALLDDVDVAAQRTTLGLGTLATQAGTVSGTHSGTSSGTNTGDQTITLTGDVSGTGTGSFATTIGESAVTTAKLPDGAITTAKIADDAVTAAKLADQSTTVIAAVSPNTNGVFTGQQWFNTVTGIAYGWDGAVWTQQAGVQSFVFTDTTPLTFSASISSVGVATITTGLDNQSAATVLSGPTTGSATAPTFRALIATDLPAAGASTKGAVQPGTGLSVAGGGVLNHTNSATPGTYTKVTVDAQGHVSTGTTLSAGDVPILDASKITTGTFAANLIGASTITGEKLANYSTVQFGGAGSTANIVTFPVANFTGQLFWDQLNNDLYISTGVGLAWLPVTVTSGELILAGTFNATTGTTGAIAALTAAGTAAGFAIGALPSPQESNKQFYFVVSIGGTPSAGQVSGMELAPPDNILSTGMAWQKIDVSAIVISSTAAQIGYTAGGGIAATNVQTAIQELDTEKIPTVLTNGNILIGNDSGIATGVGVSGDISITNTGITAITPLAIVNGDIANTTITDAKLATIATAGKVSNSATTATNANTASTIVARDASGNFIAGTITANLTGTASLATTAAACAGNAATVTTNANLTGDVTSVGNATSIAAGVIINADINASAAIVDTKLAQITTAGKVSGTAITTGNINTSGSITTSSTLLVQGLTVGKGTGAISTNTVIGVNALSANTTGAFNTANGYQALYSNTIGIRNTANGYQALHANISGDSNVAIGYAALYSNTIEDRNIAIGDIALYNLYDGAKNIVIGHQSCFLMQAGSYNTVIGDSALYSKDEGSFNVGIGYSVQASTNEVSNEVNIFNGTVTARFQGAASAWTFVSDVRDKTDVQDLTLGLDFIKALKPRTFKWNLRNTEVDRNKPSTGFIAQEVLETIKTFNASYTNLINTSDPNQYTFAQANMIPMLVKAIQELTAKVEALEARC